MSSLIQYTSRQNCTLLAVLCGQPAPLQYPFSEVSSSGRLEVHTLVNPTFEQFRETQRTVQPNFLYCQGERLGSDDAVIGELVWNDVYASDPQEFSLLISPPLPTIIYLEVPSSENIAQALHSKGVPYIIFWKSTFSSFVAAHFRSALMSVVQSSCSHTWDAFQLALASFQLYCVRNNYAMLEGNQKDIKSGPCLMGDAPKINITPAVADMIDEEAPDSLTSIQIYDEDIDVRFLICGFPCTPNELLLRSLEDGLNALLNIEIRGSKLQNRVSASPPPLQAATLTRGLVTMRCDVTTCSSTHISLLVSGSAQTCFDDQLLENHIKSELIGKSRIVHARSNNEDSEPSSSQPWNSLSIACGASVFEVNLKIPKWAAQVLKHLAPEISYRSLVALGIASVQGIPVASFEKQDADRLLYFCTNGKRDRGSEKHTLFHLPRWSAPIVRERMTEGLYPKPVMSTNVLLDNGFSSLHEIYEDKKHILDRPSVPSLLSRQRFKVAAMRPVPHFHKRKQRTSFIYPETKVLDAAHTKPPLPALSHARQNSSSFVSIAQRKSSTGPAQGQQQIIALNPLPMKKHECVRLPIQICSEEDFLMDVMQFLILRGHTRLVPPGGISEFPEAVLNAKRLDLYNLYKEVVSRGGFYVGNGINWKGQVFSKMRNHTVTNRMTGVGNTLKRHYETYLLEYELAHDDVGGDCCLLCHSSAPGDWVNCGLCGEWAHFGCDRRQGLGTFKDYAKTDGLEYICPQCSVANIKKKPQRKGNGFADLLAEPRSM